MNPCPLCEGLDPSHPDFERSNCHEDCLATVDRWKRNDARDASISWLYDAAHRAVYLARVYAREARWADVTAMFVEVLAHRSAIRKLRAEHEGLPFADTMRSPELKEVA